MKLLFVNACVNRTTSRTLKLARGVIEAMQAQEPFEVTEIVLEEEKLAPLTTESLNARQALEQKGEFDEWSIFLRPSVPRCRPDRYCGPLLGFQLPSLTENIYRAHRYSGGQLCLY